MADTNGPPPTARGHELPARTGLLVVIGVAVVMMLAALLVFTHRPHTPQLTPGQKQPPAIALLGLAQPS
jgi:hypothetical protein